MNFELKNILEQAQKNQKLGLKNVLATVVALEGSSYRKPGVRMLIDQKGKMIGAVSGGCVEKEVCLRAKSVFKDNKAKIITYDGRYRLGCEGILYILIEPIKVTNDLFHKFLESNNKRKSYQIQSYFKKEEKHEGDFGSIIKFYDGTDFSFSETFTFKNFKGKEVFTQTLKPSFRLLIIGGEHDAVKLCSMASLLGWEVEVITSVKDIKSIADFPGANSVTGHTPDTLSLKIDCDTAVVLMTHNYVQDLKYLLKLEPFDIKYIGILGSTKRREQLFNELTHYAPDVSEQYLEAIYSPAGLHIGAITPQEIALSILSEILSVIRNTEVVSLRTYRHKTPIR
tara:strand:+ start:382 stop:1401 length:1020 start_codon:yes stop_codon:yes gene_type:complete